MLKGLLAGAAGAAASGFRLPLVHAADHRGKLFVFVQADGGWDPTSFCDPKANTPGEPVINHWAERDEVRQAGRIPYAPFARNQAFFEKYHRRMLVINGVDAQTNSHTVGIVHNWSGRNSEGYPTTTALLCGALCAGPAGSVPELRGVALRDLLRGAPPSPLASPASTMRSSTCCATASPSPTGVGRRPGGRTPTTFTEAVGRRGARGWAALESGARTSTAAARPLAHRQRLATSARAPRPVLPGDAAPPRLLPLGVRHRGARVLRVKAYADAIPEPEGRARARLEERQMT